MSQPVILTTAQRQIALSQIERLGGKPPHCVFCDSADVSIGDKLFRLELDGLVGTGAPVVALACHRCQHISTFSAVGLGVIDY